MKHNILFYTLIAAAMTAAGCAVDKAAAPASADKAKAPAVKANQKAAAKPAAKAPAVQPAKKVDPAAQKRAEEQAKKQAEAEAKKKAEAEYQAKTKEIREWFGTMNKRRGGVPKAKQIELIREKLKDPAFADARLQLQMQEQVIRLCQGTDFLTVDYYRKPGDKDDLADMAKLVLANKNLTAAQKLFSLRALAIHLCDLNKYPEAEKLVKDFIASNKIVMEGKLEGNGSTARSLHFLLADLYRLQDRFDDAMKEVNATVGTMGEWGPKGVAEWAMKFGRTQEALTALNKLETSNKLLWLADRRRADLGYAEAIAFIKDPKSNPNRVIEVAKRYVFDSYGSDELSRLRRSLAGIPAKNDRMTDGNATVTAFQRGDYRLAAELYEIFAGTKQMGDVRMRKIYLISLAAIGKKDMAARVADSVTADESAKPVDRMRCKFYSYILRGKSTDGLLKDSKLSRKEQSEVILSAARQCLIWNMSELAMKYSAEYQKYFAERPHRQMTVKYFETPISNISDWRKVYPRLDKQMCNIPFGGSLDFLETDVATGNRYINFDKNSKEIQTLELTALADRNGLHLFLRAEAENARAIEQGFASGIGTEMYFAPGKDQPYTCFGSNPRDGIEFDFQTTYDNANARRLNMKGQHAPFQNEVGFSDKDYVLHLFFTWDQFYNKLPQNGTEYLFECIAWTAKGGMTWGGSQGVHEVSSWGGLKFELTPKQLTEIRKQILFHTFRSYQMVPREPGVSENLFDIWADTELGDPEFYKQYLAQLRAELEGYAKRVKADMTDADVAEIYSKALFRMKGLGDEIDQLRRKYMTDRLIQTGK